MADKFLVSKLRDEDGNIEEDMYVYRGVEFERRSCVASGYFGRYIVGKSFRSQHHFSYQYQVKDFIDRQVAKNAK